MRKILVVDDEAGVLTAICELISDHEFAVIAETSLWKALSKCARDSPDLVLCDLMLVDVKHAAVLPSIRSRLPDVPIILMSSMAERHVRTLVPGNYGFLQKPFTVPQLLARLEAAVSPGKYLRQVKRDAV